MSCKKLRRRISGRICSLNWPCFSEGSRTIFKPLVTERIQTHLLLGFSFNSLISCSSPHPRVFESAPYLNTQKRRFRQPLSSRETPPTPCSCRADLSSVFGVGEWSSLRRRGMVLAYSAFGSSCGGARLASAAFSSRLLLKDLLGQRWGSDIRIIPC